MRKMFTGGVVSLCAAAAPALAGGGALMVVDSTADDVMLFDAFDGHLIQQTFIDLTPVGAQTPINAIPVGNEVWVSDQLSDAIYRFSQGGTHLGTITGGMDNIRGLEVVGDTVYVSNAGTGNGAPGEAVITIDVPTLSVTGFFLVGDDASGDPFDVHAWNGGLLVNDIDGDDIEFHGLDGEWLSTFHDSDGTTGIDFPEQLSSTPAGNVLAAGFSSPIGIYEYDGEGAQLNYYAVGDGDRGVHLLGNGNIMFTDSDGVHVLDPNTGGVTDVFLGASGRFIDLIPAPGTGALLGLGAIAAVRRRR